MPEKKMIIIQWREGIEEKGKGEEEGKNNGREGGVAKGGGTRWSEGR